MLTHYIVQTVSPSAVCSYRRGRTLLNGTGGAYSSLADAEREAELFNANCDCAGIVYSVLSTDDAQPEGFDQLERE